MIHFLDFLIRYKDSLMLKEINLENNEFKINTKIYEKFKILSSKINIIYEENKEDINHIINKINLIKDKINNYTFSIDKIKIKHILSGDLLLILKTDSSIYSYNIKKYDSMKNKDGDNIYDNFKVDKFYININKIESPIEVNIIQIRNEDDKIIPVIKGNINLKKKEQDKNISILLSYSNNNVYVYNDDLYDSNNNPIGMINGEIEKLI